MTEIEELTLKLKERDEFIENILAELRSVYCMFGRVKDLAEKLKSDFKKFNEAIDVD